MTDTEYLIAEVRQLRADVARLHAGVLVRHTWTKMFFKDLSTNPHTQYKVHKWGAIYWLINFPLYLATDYGGMSAAEAAFEGPQQQLPPPIPLEPPVPPV